MKFIIFFKYFLLLFPRYSDMNSVTPLVFVLSAGSDPMAQLQRFAVELNMKDSLESISLGQGQGPVAEALLDRGRVEGLWIFLQVKILYIIKYISNTIYKYDSKILISSNYIQHSSSLSELSFSDIVDAVFRKNSARSSSGCGSTGAP